MDLILVRLIFILFVSFTCFLIHPFGLSPRLDAAVGALLGAAIVIFEWRLLRVSLKRLIGAAIGSIDLPRKASGAYADADFKGALSGTFARILNGHQGVIWIVTNNKPSG